MSYNEVIKENLTKYKENNIAELYEAVNKYSKLLSGFLNIVDYVRVLNFLSCGLFFILYECSYLYLTSYFKFCIPFIKEDSPKLYNI